ncbi:MAG: protein phosphatase 2C domain-containing protein [Bacteroidales bacterium]|nr:protein phosphatase 2C domain-containing protein [Bacteroidales bacterium]
MKLKTISSRLAVVAKTSVGMVRSNNEDYHGFSTNLREKEWRFYESADWQYSDVPAVLVVADGMGGMEMGEEASRIAVETVKSYVFENSALLTDDEATITEKISNVFKKANEEILKFAETSNNVGKMGTTLVVSIVFKKHTYVFWIGDSRAYLFRNAKLQPLSKDHSYVQELVDSGKLSYEQSFYHPDSNIITKFMGDPKSIPIPSVLSFEHSDGDILLLCSDGLNGMLLDSEIESCFYDKDSLIQICDTLIDSANQAGGHDNITVILGGVGEYKTVNKSDISEGDSDVIIVNKIEHQKGKSSKRRSRVMLIFLIVFLLVMAVFATLCFTGVLFPNKSKYKKDKVQSEEVDKSNKPADGKSDTVKEIEIQDKVKKSAENDSNDHVEIVLVPNNIIEILNGLQNRIGTIDSETSKQITNILNHRAKNDESGFDNNSQMLAALQKLIDKLKKGDDYYKAKAEEIQAEIDKL